MANQNKEPNLPPVDVADRDEQEFLIEQYKKALDI